MSYSLNKVMILGRAGKDPETRYSNSGTPITTFSLATSRRWQDRATEEWREETDWHNVVCFARTAEIASEYLRKGNQCFIEGELRTNSWERDGVRQYRTEIHVRNLILLGRDSGSSYGDRPPRSGHGSRQLDDDSERRSSSGGSRDRTVPADDVSMDDDLDDDIPF